MSYVGDLIALTKPKCVVGIVNFWYFIEHWGVNHELAFTRLRDLVNPIYFF